MGQGFGAAMGQGAMGQLWGGAAVRGIVHCRWTRITSNSYGAGRYGVVRGIVHCRWMRITSGSYGAGRCGSVLWGNYGSGLWDSYGAGPYGAAMGQGAMGRRSDARQRALQVDEDYIQQRWSRALWGRAL